MAAKLEMETLTEGNGEIAEVGKRVSVHYEGRLEDGTVFDGSRPRGQAFSFTIGAGQVIRGWEQGVAGMKVGETRRLTIPPELGYGEAGAGGVIPPNATLVFEIELLEVTTPVTLGQATAEDLLKAQAEGVVRDKRFFFADRQLCLMERIAPKNSAARTVNPNNHRLYSIRPGTS